MCARSNSRRRISLQLRLGLLDEEPNSAFFRSLMPSESRGQSQEKECCAQLAALRRLMSPAGAAACGLPMLPVTGGAFSVSFFREACLSCCCLVANAAAM